MDYNEKDAQKIHDCVARLIREDGKLSSRKLSDAVYDETDIRVSHVTIQKILRALGYSSVRWVSEAVE